MIRAGTERARRPVRGLGREDGQVLIMVAAGMVVFIAVVGLVVDVGRLYVAQRQLQIAADAAALAGAQSLPNGAAARTVACTYSATDRESGRCDGAPMGADAKNTVGSLPGVETSTTLECLSATSAGAGCVTGDGCDTNPLPPSYAWGEVATRSR